MRKRSQVSRKRVVAVGVYYEQRQPVIATERRAGQHINGGSALLNRYDMRCQHTQLTRHRSLAQPGLGLNFVRGCGSSPENLLD